MKLTDYLDTEGIKRHVFAKKIGVSAATLRNLEDGYDTFVSTAWDIQCETQGSVKMKDLIPTKSRPTRTKKEQPIQPAA